MDNLIKVLKKVRLAKKQGQSALGGKLGLPQSHISNIEREEIDPRLSTVVNIARALEQELVLVPRHMLPAVKALIHHQSNEQIPMWVPDEEGDEE